MNFLLIPTNVSDQKYVPEKTKAAVSKVFFFVCTKDRDSFIESMETVSPSLKDFYFENCGKELSKFEEGLKISSSLKKVLECIARGYFDRKTLKANAELKEFDAGFVEMLSTQMKSEISLVSLVEYVLARIDEKLTSEEFKLSFTVNCVP